MPILLWLIGIPIPIIILLMLLHHQMSANQIRLLNFREADRGKTPIATKARLGN
ncbi:MAG: hypothetical protein WA639_08905 [Candidatus Acidiferrum sp.]